MKNFLLTTTIIFSVLLTACGGGGGSSVAMEDMPMTPPDLIGSDTMPVAQNTNFGASDEDGRTRVASATQKLGSVTQSSRVTDGTTIDSLGIRKNPSGSPVAIQRIVNGQPQYYENSRIPIIDFTIENSVEGWAGSESSPPPDTYLVARGSISDGSTLQAKEEYEPGDYYYVTGFWYRDANDFGVFTDATPRTEPLPASGSATYSLERGLAAYFWNNGTGASFGYLTGDLELNASFNDDDNMQISGSADINKARIWDGNDFGPERTGSLLLNFNNIVDTDGDGGFVGGDITCPQCVTQGASSWGGQFFGNPLTLTAGEFAGDSSGEWPTEFGGTFAAKNLLLSDGVNLDLLGWLAANHSGLVDAWNY